MRGLVKGKRWLLLTRWVNLTAGKRRQLNELFTLNRRLLKAYLLKESLDRLWDYRYAGAMVRYFQGWMDQLRWQRLIPFQKLAEMLLDHFDGILNYCVTKVPLGVVEAINGNIKTLLRRGRGYTNLRYLLLKAQRLAATKIEFVAFEKAAWNGRSVGFLRRAGFCYGYAEVCQDRYAAMDVGVICRQLSASPWSDDQCRKGKSNV
jgi:transposase